MAKISFGRAQRAPTGSLIGARCARPAGFTLVELVLVLVVMSLLGAIAGRRFGTFDAWKEDSFLRRLTETIRFIHYQAIADSSPYALEFDLKNNAYRVGAFRSDSDVNNNLTSNEDSANQSNDEGIVSLELRDYITPRIFKNEEGGTLIPPPSYPSLFDTQNLPNGSEITEIKDASGTQSKNSTSSVITVADPKGFSDFCVIHLKLKASGEKTIFVNPFTGVPTIYNGYREFNWTLPGDKN